MTSDADLVLSNVNIIDIDSGEVQSGKDISIRGSLIVGIETHSPERAASTISLDLKGKYVIPGLWDMHTHIRTYDFDEMLPMFIVYGVTGIRDLGLSDYDELMRWQAAIAAGDLVGPDIVATAAIIEGPDLAWRSSIPVSDVAEARAIVDLLVDKGVPILKLFHNMSPEAFATGVDYGNQKGLFTVGHLPDGWSQSDAAALGIDSVEHLWGLVSWAPGSPPNILNSAQISLLASELRNAGVYQSPTIMGWSRYAVFAKSERSLEEAVLALDSHPLRKYVPPYHLAHWRRVSWLGADETESAYNEALARVEYGLDLVYQLQREGVSILAGTDTPNPWAITGISLHDELELYVRGGMTPLESLQAATINPARFFGNENSQGAAKVGYVASLVVLDNNPMEDIVNTRKIHAVIANGRLYTKDDIDLLRDAQAGKFTEIDSDDIDQYLYMDVRRYGSEEALRRLTESEGLGSLNFSADKVGRLIEKLRAAGQNHDAEVLDNWLTEHSN